MQVIAKPIRDFSIKKNIPIKEDKPLERPEVLHGATYKIKLDHMPHAFYIVINHAKVEDKIVPFELFINSLDPGHLAWAGITSRLVSAIFRKGGDISFVIKELKEIFEASSFWYNGVQYNSIAEVIGEVIEKHCKHIGYEVKI